MSKLTIAKKINEAYQNTGEVPGADVLTRKSVLVRDYGEGEVIYTFKDNSKLSVSEHAVLVLY